MRKIAFLLIIIFMISSCKKESTQLLPNIDINSIKGDFMKWWTYHNNNIILSSNFTAFNKTSQEISKEDFLLALTTGNYVPLKLKANANQYQLYKLDDSFHESIVTTIKNVSLDSYKYFKMEGAKIPEFDFTDINGTRYTSENTKGKTILLKNWFINCTACVLEFPELNQLVDDYKNNNNFLFISLATDKNEDLQKFLSKKPFKYTTVGNQKDYIINKLNVTEYPTHFIIDKNGVIQKVVSNSHELISALKTFYPVF